MFKHFTVNTNSQSMDVVEEHRTTSPVITGSFNIMRGFSSKLFFSLFKLKNNLIFLYF